MKQECLSVEEMSAHIDGDLESVSPSQVEAHLEVCGKCRQARADLLLLKGDLKHWRDLKPARDLWQEIDAEIPQTQSTTPAALKWLPRLVPIPIAAAAAIAVYIIAKQPADEPAKQPTPPTLDQAIVAVQQAESSYRDAIASLEKVLEKEKAGFNPDTLAVIEKSLKEIDDAIERSREALLKDPDNIEANRAMLAAYRQKMDFLFELVGPRIRRQGA